MKRLLSLFLKVMLVFVIIGDVIYFSFASSIREDIVRESIKK